MLWKIRSLSDYWFGPRLAYSSGVLEPDTGGTSTMAARKTILLILAVLLPCGFLILLTRSVLRSSFGERFLKGAITMRKLAFLASAVLSVVAMTAGCGGGSQTTQPLAARSVSLSIRDNPPKGVSVLSFEINVTGASLQPSDASKPAVPLVTSPIEVELTECGERS